MSQPLLTNGQQELIDLPANDPVLTQLSTLGDFTGARLYEQDPTTYKRIVVLLAHKWGVLRIAQELGVSKNTVRAVRRREGESIDLVSQHLGEQVRSVGEDLLEHGSALLTEIMESPIRRRDATISDVAKLTDAALKAIEKHQLLTGQPTARIQISDLQAPEHDDFNAYLASLKSAGDGLSGGKNGGQIVDVDAASVQPSTPPEDRAPDTTPDPEPDCHQPGTPAVSGPVMGPADVESAGQTTNHQ